MAAVREREEQSRLGPTGLLGSRSSSGIDLRGYNSSSVTDTTAEGSAFGGRDGLRLGENGVVLDAHSRKVGMLEQYSIFSRPFWTHLNKGFRSLNDSALFEHARPRELHVALASVGELFVLAGSLISGFSLSLLQVIDIKALNAAWYLSTLLFVSLSFVSGIAAVSFAAVIFLGVSTTPISHVNLFAAHLGSWILRPGFLLCASFGFLGVAFALTAMRGPFQTARIVCVSLVGLAFVGISVVAMVVLVKVVAVRDFVEDDVRKHREAQKRARDAAKQQNKKNRSVSSKTKK
uniref:Transmembrane protein n=1 Tax=Erythrolobus madagascarensis TaxID=708628 RepID=A0A7S0T4Y9_9RHOD|mmetsp:Transcript_3/g.9  ORF Transcript_3/g.9 Transcript_3/m.9 type:complete len:291 (+) Transcript_3:109-981(+)